MTNEKGKKKRISFLEFRLPRVFTKAENPPNRVQISFSQSLPQPELTTWGKLSPVTLATTFIGG